jgi:hypothetical protein
MPYLIANVHADGTWWGPDYGNADQVPDEVAEQITADVWAPDQPAGTVDLLDEAGEVVGTLAVGDGAPSSEPEPETFEEFEEWLARADVDTVLDRLADAPDDETLQKVVEMILGVERAGENRQEMIDALVALLPDVPMTDEEKAAAETGGDGQTSPDPDVAAPGDPGPESDEFIAWVNGSSIDVIEEQVVAVDEQGRSSYVARILAVDEQGRARKGLVERLGQYMAD